MKKLLIFALIFIIAGIMIFGIAMAGVGFDFLKLDGNEYVTTTYDINEGFDSIVIDIEVADIEFVVSTNGEAKVEVFEAEEGTYKASAENGVLTVSGKQDKKWYDWLSFSLKNSKITVTVPSDKLYTLKIENTTGDVKIPDGFSFADVAVKVTTGDLHLKLDKATAVKLEITTGDIDVSGLKTDSIEIYGGTGNVKLDDVMAASISIDVTTGDVSLDGISVSDTVSVHATTGDIKLKALTANSASLKTTSGDIALTDAIMNESLYIKATTAEISIYESDANYIEIDAGTGDICATLLSGKSFDVKVTTGDVRVPSDSEGGVCKIKATTADVEIAVLSK